MDDEPKINGEEQEPVAEEATPTEETTEEDKEKSPEEAVEETA